MRNLLLLCCLVVSFGCTPKTAEQVADRFVDLYFVRIDQERAKAFSSGLAAAKLEQELTLVKQIRQEAGVNVDKPDISYTRKSINFAGDHARAMYEIRVHQGHDTSQQGALISLEKTADRWYVANYLVGNELRIKATP